MDCDGDPLFSSGLPLAALSASSNLLQDSWAAISVLVPRIDGQHVLLPSPRLEPGTFRSDGGDPVIIREFRSPDYNIIAFVTSPVTTASLQINGAAVSLFNSLRGKLSPLREEILTLAKYRDGVPYVITGHGWGGSIASLFTLWLLNEDRWTWRNIRPLCITFGSPLLGDSAFQQAVLQNSTWNSSFLHVVHKDDSSPRAFLRPPTTHQSPYKPFGTFLLCSESGGACFESPESVMELLMSEIIAGDQEPPQSVDYKNAIERLEQRFIYGNCSRLNGQEADSYKAGVTIEVTAVGLTPIQKNEGNDALIEDIVNHERGVIRRKREAFDPMEEFDKMKESLGLLECYMMLCRGNGLTGYYDRFKNTREGLTNNGVEKYQAILTDYWESVVEEAVKNPASGTSGAPLRNRWLFAGNNYRKIVEPLDIAEYYRNGGKDYLNRGRSKHYKLLEQWLNPWASAGPSQSKVEKVMEDSCFWARVEEAIRSCRRLDRNRAREEKASLKQFEQYVMDMIRNRKVSPDIFLERSSYMQWWREYDEILKDVEGDSDSHQSELADYMRAGDYKKYGEKPPTDSNENPSDTSHPVPTTSGDPRGSQLVS